MNDDPDELIPIPIICCMRVCVTSRVDLARKSVADLPHTLRCCADVPGRYYRSSQTWILWMRLSFVWCCRVDTDRSISTVVWQCIISYISAAVQKQYSIKQRNMVRKRIESIIMKLLVCT